MPLTLISKGGGGAVKQQNQGLVLPVGETIRLDYIGAETVVTHLVSHEQGKLPGHWTLETTDDGEVGTMMCQDANGQFDMQDVFEVLKKKVAVKVATGEYWVTEQTKDDATKTLLLFGLHHNPTQSSTGEAFGWVHQCHCKFQHISVPQSQDLQALSLLELC